MIASKFRGRSAADQRTVAAKFALDIRDENRQINRATAGKAATNRTIPTAEIPTLHCLRIKMKKFQIRAADLTDSNKNAIFDSHNR